MKKVRIAALSGTIAILWLLSGLLSSVPAWAGTPIQDKYQLLAGPVGTLGGAIGAEKCGLTGGGCYQDYHGGQIHWTPSTGARATWGAIGAVWRQQGWEQGSLGYAVSDEVCGLVRSGCYQSFQGGQVHWSPASGAQQTRWGAIRNRWAGAGFESGPLGYPVAAERCSLAANGCYQAFQSGQIHWAPGIGAYATGGSIDYVWGTLGWENGRLGYPVTDEVCPGDGSCSQDFQGGTLTWRQSTGVTVSYYQPGEYQQVINKHTPLSPIDYAPSDVVNVGGQPLRYQAALGFWQFADAANASGVAVTVVSGFRSYASQGSLYNSYVAMYGQERADTISARPGYSEHQSGLAVDIGNPSGACALQECFALTAAGQFASSHAHEFGFIIRYPAGLSEWTGYAYEPWHLRYVGKDVAMDMHRRGINTLEQYYGYSAAPRY
jgi:D-alanyl-D-alanine carboxypeptidase